MEAFNSCLSSYLDNIYLTAKETLNDMNMFDRTHAFVQEHFIRHYTGNNIFFLINVKNAKTAPYMGKHRI